jgi:hypothetical protein
MTERLIGYWTYEAKDYIDYSPSGNDGTGASGNARPGFVAGHVGAWALDLDGNDYVTIDGVAADLMPNNDITMSAWVKTAADGELLVCNTGSGDNVILLDIDGGVAAGYPVVWGTTTVNDDSWHLLTFVRSGSDAYLYVDGVQEAADTGSFSFDPTDLWSIGQEWDGGSPSDFLTGQTDDSRVYNYALTYNEVSDLYLAVEGGWVCQEVDEFDVTGPTPGVPDCVVNILDWSEFAKQWLVCGRTPQTECVTL